MGGHAWGPMGLAAPRAWGAPQRRSSPRAGRQMGQDPFPLHPCAGPRAPSAFGTRLWQGGGGGNSARDSRWGEALSRSVPGTPPGSDSDSAGRAPWVRPPPMAKDPAWGGMALSRPCRNTKPMLTERASRCRNRRNALSPLPSASDALWTGGLGVRSFHYRSPSAGLWSPKNSGIQATWSQSLDKEAWAPSSSDAYPGALRWSRDKPVDRGDSWSPGAAPRQGTGSALRPSLRRPALGDPPAEGDGQRWAREPTAWSGRGAKDCSLGRVTWAPL